jgi:mono/diheme cytochrome c family protein
MHTIVAMLLLGVACASAAQGRDGADIYARRCINCHSIARMTELLPTLGTPDTLRERLKALLPIHHAPDPDEREQLIDFVMALRREP